MVRSRPTAGWYDGPVGSATASPVESAPASARSTAYLKIRLRSSTFAESGPPSLRIW